jgi:hypothetical protein
LLIGDLCAAGAKCLAALGADHLSLHGFEK